MQKDTNTPMNVTEPFNVDQRGGGLPKCLHKCIHL